VYSTRANVVWAGSVQVIEKLTGYLVIAVLTRTLLKADVGLMFFASTVSGLAAAILSFGTENYLVRAIAVEPEKSIKHLSIVLSVRLRNALIVYALTNLLFWLVQPELSPALLLVSAYDFLEEIYYCFAAFFSAERKVIYRLITMGAIKVLTLILVSAAAYLTHALYPVLFAYLILDIVLVAAAYIPIQRNYGHVTLDWDYRRHLGIMRESVSFFLYNLLNIVHLRLDTLMVGFLLDLVQVANYDLGMRLLEAARFIVRPVHTVFYPIFSEMAARGRWKRLRLRAIQITSVAFVAGMALAIGMQFLGPTVIVWLFGAQYRDSIIPAQILFLSMPLVFVHFVLNVLANSLRMERTSVAILAISTLVNLVLNMIVIPRYGIIGAAWATVVTQAMLVMLLLWLVASKLLRSDST
jgi:polysaccharide transporter, PST family